MKTISSWLLGGALAASLTWNWRLVADGEAPAPAPDAATCATGRCVPGTEALALDPARRAALDELCARSCGASERLEQRAGELRSELLSGLSADSLDRAAAHELVREIGELRHQSLSLCVDGILELRELLGQGEVRALLELCETGCCR